MYFDQLTKPADHQHAGQQNDDDSEARNRLAGVSLVVMPNLAAPDMLIWWTNSIPFISTPDSYGWFIYLGPHQNILPIVAVSLMLVQQNGQCRRRSGPAGSRLRVLGHLILWWADQLKSAWVIARWAALQHEGKRCVDCLWGCRRSEDERVARAARSTRRG